ncbi:MAG: hypothetical protein IJT44_02145 [Clostridia bacterium]|nr:hypothetical protein [Clostridia bacterium]
MKWIRSAAETYRTLSETTKKLLTFCAVYMLLILFCAAAVRLCAGGLMGYYTAVRLSADLLGAVRPCVGVTALGALLVEGVLRAA